MGKRSLRSIFVFPILVSGVVFAASVNGQEQSLPDLVFGTGAEGGAYWQLAKRFEQVVVREGVTVDVQETQGSFENLERLSDSKDTLNIALTQADTFLNYLDNNQGMVNKIKTLAPIGLECVFVVTRTNSDLNNEKDWQSAMTPRVAVHALGSGSAMTYEYMAHLIPELKDDILVDMKIADVY